MTLLSHCMEEMKLSICIHVYGKNTAEQKATATRQNAKPPQDT